MKPPDRTADEIGEDEPVRLDVACRLFFGGAIKPTSLRTECAKGNLEIIQIARKDFVTKRGISAMKQKCRVQRSPLASGSEVKPTAAGTPARGGSSKTAPSVTAQDALRSKLSKRKDNSPNTSPRSTSPKGVVVPIKSQSATS